MYKYVSTAFVLLIMVVCQANIITVDGDGFADFDNIQAAIDDANNGDIVIVEPNTYYENINFTGKSITFTSLDPDDSAIVEGTVIDGGGVGPTVTFSGSENSDSLLIGFTIRGANNTWGGGIKGNNCSGTIRQCIITENNAAFGGGLYEFDGLISNCVVSNNSASRGGGLRDCDGDIINCTIALNMLTGSSFDGSGLSRCKGKIKNCIIWENSRSFEIDNCSQPTYSCWSGATGTGNISAEPGFVLMPDGMGGFKADCHLYSTAGRWDPNSKTWVQDEGGPFVDGISQCIDAGDPNSDWTAELWPHGKRTNMGAYGGTPQASMSLSSVGNVANINNNDIVDYTDLMMLTHKWQCQEVLLSEDFDRNGVVNLIDFAIFAKEWLWEE